MFISPSDIKNINMIRDSIQSKKPVGQTTFGSDEYISGLSSRLQGSDYANLFNSNPYLNFTRKDGLWDKMGDFFGFRTAQDKAWDSQLNSAREYAGQVAQLQFENHYNSPEAMAERLRQAGINPDLNGIGDVSSAGEFAQEQTSPEFSENEDVLNKAGNILTMLISASGSALGIASQFKELENMNLKNDAQEISNYLQLSGLVPDYISQFLLPDNPHGLMDNGGVLDVKTVTDFATNPNFSPFLSKRNRIAFGRSINQMFDSVKDYANRYKYQNEYLNSRKDYITSHADSRFHGFNDGITPDQADRNMISDFKPLIDFMIVHQMDQLRAEDALFVNQYDYETELNSLGQPTLEAGADTDASRAKSKQAQYQKELNDALAKTLRNLLRSAESGDVLALIRWCQLMSYINGSSTPLSDIGDALSGIGNFALSAKKAFSPLKVK